MVSAGVGVEPEIESAKKYYRVQVGAFSDKKNAEALMVRLKKAGFDPYMKYE
jgi:cell division septation protein DedD